MHLIATDFFNVSLLYMNLKEYRYTLCALKYLFDILCDLLLLVTGFTPVKINDYKVIRSKVLQ